MLVFRVNRVIAAAACLSVAVLTAVHASDLDAYEGLVRKWVDVRAETAAARRDWADRKLEWLEEIKLLEREKADLEEEVSETGALSSSFETERVRVLESKEAMDAALRGLRPHLDRAETHARKWEARVPPSLSSGLRKAFAQIPETHQQAERLSVTRRLQLVVALFTEVESLQHGLYVVKEMLPTGEGLRREVDVLYIGMSRAFAVSPGNEWAAVGEPLADGWSWSARPELGAEIRRALDVVNRRVPAGLVTLPMAVRDPVPARTQEAAP